MTLRHLTAMALALAASAPVAAQDVRGALFAVVRTNDGRGVLEPVALLLPNGFTTPGREHSDSVEQAFSARWLAVGHAYNVLVHGERAGTFTVGTSDMAGCYGVTVRGTLDVRPAPHEGWQALAGSGLPAQPGAPWLRPPTEAEKRTLDGMAAALFVAHGINEARRTAGDTVIATLQVHRNARPVLVGSYRLDEEAGPWLRRASTLVIAEEGEDGYRPAHVWFHEGVEAGVEAQELVDAADLDGDGIPELVVRTLYYESWDFTILRRGDLGWTAVYRGGGGGC